MYLKSSHKVTSAKPFASLARFRSESDYTLVRDLNQYFILMEVVSGFFYTGLLISGTQHNL